MRNKGVCVHSAWYRRFGLNTISANSNERTEKQTRRVPANRRTRQAFAAAAA